MQVERVVDIPAVGKSPYTIPFFISAVKGIAKVTVVLLEAEACGNMVPVCLGL
jgi:hypothetical protein